jgi:CheY-like chemotaxis protein
MSGSDVLEAMMQDEYLRRIPVVVMSSRNDK